MHIPSRWPRIRATLGQQGQSQCALSEWVNESSGVHNRGARQQQDQKKAEYGVRCRCDDDVDTVRMFRSICWNVCMVFRPPRVGSKLVQVGSGSKGRQWRL